MCVFITAGPSTKLFACVGGDSGGHVLRETTSRGLRGLVCPSRNSVRGGEGDCVKEGGGGEGQCERERALERLLVEGSFHASTRAGMAHAHSLSTWFNANGKHGSSHLLFPVPHRPDHEIFVFTHTNFRLHLANLVHTILSLTVNHPANPLGCY